jgi:ribosome-binding protein aMBF1 (putative translation factor)
MDDLDRYVAQRKAEDPEFRKEWERAQANLDFQKAMIGARLAAGISQRELAKRIGTSQAAVARMESGMFRPRVDTLLKLAVALKITFEVDGSGLRVRAA